MKRLTVVLLSLLIATAALPVAVFADSCPNDADTERTTVSEPTVEGTWRVRSVKPKSGGEQFALLNSVIGDVVDTRNRIVKVDSYYWEKYGADYAEITIYEQEKRKTYVVKVEYIEPDKSLVDEAAKVGKQLERAKEYTLEDMGVLGYYNEYGPRELNLVNGSTSDLVNRTSLVKNLDKSSDISIKLQMEGFGYYWFAKHLMSLVTGGPAVNIGAGPSVVFNKGIPCYVLNIPLFKKNVIYVPEDSRDVLGDAKKRIASYLGHKNFDFEVGGTQESLNTDSWKFNPGGKLDESKLADDKYYILTLNGTTYMFFLYRMPEENLEMPEVPKESVRVFGKNRYETAVKTADELKKVLGVNKFDTIIVASGDNYADALAGSYLAKVKKAPILVVNKFNEAPAMEYIKKNIASGGKVYLLGGNGAVTAGFEKSAKKICTVERLGGKDRFETNLNILKEAGVGNEELVICSAWDFADSLSASSVGKPILLTDTHLSAVQKSFIKGLKTDKCYLIGGKGAVSTAVQSEVKAIGKRTERISGANRYDTSVAVAKKFSESKEKDIVLANGDDFPDGLVGGPLAYFMKSPLILINERNTASAAGFAKEYASERMVILGGKSLISDETADKIIK